MKNDQIKILLVDDEPDILEIVGFHLKKEGYQVKTAKDGLEGIEKAKKFEPHLILLDIMMPKKDGIETCEEIRTIPGMEKVIIAFFTARGEDYSQVAGYEAGADDYITKPVKPKVLVSKVNALLRRLKSEGTSKSVVRFNDILINKEEHFIEKNGRRIELPRKEFKLLLLLSGTPNKVFNREEILKSVWGKDVVVGDRTIDVHIRKLREKLGDNLIKTIKGVGYKAIEYN